MTFKAFISYSHADDRYLERLHKHLVMLQREGAIASWSDHAILPGDEVNSRIKEELSNSQLFLAILSPDYLASNYCYDIEFQHAQQMAATGNLRIVPIVAEPCDWLASPFREYMALPKDGKAISEWANQNNAYLDVVTGLRRIAAENVHYVQNENISKQEFQTGRRPKIKQDFDAIQRQDFADKAFRVISEYFDASCRELNDVGDGALKAKFEWMDSTAFTCTVVNRARRSGGDADITVWNGKGRSHYGDISYVFERYADRGATNGSIIVDADEYRMFLKLDSFYSFSNDKNSANTPENVAELLWLEFVKKAGIGYD